MQRGQYLKVLALQLLACATIAGPGAASAASLPKEGITVDEVATWLRAKGCPAEIDAQRRYVSCKRPNAMYVVFTSDCANGRCTSVQFFYGLSFSHPLTPDAASANALVNDWNDHYRWVKAVAEPSGNVALQGDQFAAAPASMELLDKSLDMFLTGVETFKGYLKKKGLVE